MSYGRYGWTWGLGMDSPYTVEYARELYDKVVKLMEKAYPSSFDKVDFGAPWREQEAVDTLFEPFYWLQTIIIDKIREDNGDHHPIPWIVDVGEGWVGFCKQDRQHIPCDVADIAVWLGETAHYYEVG